MRDCSRMGGDLPERARPSHERRLGQGSELERAMASGRLGRPGIGQASAAPRQGKAGQPSDRPARIGCRQDGYYIRGKRASESK